MVECVIPMRRMCASSLLSTASGQASARTLMWAVIMGSVPEWGTVGWRRGESGSEGRRQAVRGGGEEGAAQAQHFHPPPALQFHTHFYTNTLT